MAVLPRSGEIVLTEMSQRFHIDHLGRVMDAALQGCQVLTFDKVFRVSNLIKSMYCVQGVPSGCLLGFVIIKTKIEFKHKVHKLKTQP